MDELRIECPICDHSIPATSKRCPFCSTELSTSGLDELEELAMSIGSVSEKVGPTEDELQPVAETDSDGSHEDDGSEIPESVESETELPDEGDEMTRKERKKALKVEKREKKATRKKEKRDKKIQRKAEKRSTTEPTSAEKHS